MPWDKIHPILQPVSQCGCGDRESNTHQKCSHEDQKEAKKWRDCTLRAPYAHNFSHGMMFRPCALPQIWTTVIQTWPGRHKRARLRRSHKFSVRFLSSRYVNQGKKAWQWRAVTAALWGRRLSGQRAISLLTCTRRLPGHGPHRTANLIFTVEMVLSPRLALAWTHTGSCRIPPESMYCQNIKPVVKCPCAFSWFMSYRAVSLERLCEWRFFSHLAVHISTLFNLFFRLFIYFFCKRNSSNASTIATS